MKKPILLALVPFAVLALALTTWSALSDAPAHWPETGREIDLARDRSFLEARNRVAQSGEIGLVIDPSVPSVEIVHGAVPLRAAAIEKIRVAASLRRADPGEPLIGGVAGRRGVLPKDPINRIIAPPDTSAAEPPATKPLDADPAYGTIELDNGVSIRLLPTDESGWNLVRGAAFRIAEHARRVARVVNAAVGAESAPYAADVVLRIPDADARAIYRALDDGALVAIRTGAVR